VREHLWNLAPVSRPRHDTKEVLDTERDARPVVGFYLWHRHQEIRFQYGPRSLTEGIDERRALTHHFSVAGQEGYLTVGVYEDGVPGEIFITMSKQGSTISGLMDSFATAVSLALQYGVPLEVLCGKLTHLRFEPSGWSGNPKIGYAKSIVDYIFRCLS
jgi:hypothetical protein